MTLQLALGGAAGRMGTAIQEAVADRDDMAVALTCDPDGGDVDSIDAYSGSLDDIDVYIDFTTPETVITNIETAAQAGIDTIVGTTGWYDHDERVGELARDGGVRVLYSPNFATGINAVFGAVEYLAAVLGDQAFDASVVEKHHTGKADAPSGTAKRIAELLLDHMETKETEVNARTGPHSDGDLDVVGVRVGDEPGEHEITFTAPGHSEKLVLRHESFGTDVFADGVVRAIDWLVATNVDPGLYTFKEDVLED